MFTATMQRLLLHVSAKIKKKTPLAQINITLTATVLTDFEETL